MSRKTCIFCLLVAAVSWVLVRPTAAQHTLDAADSAHAQVAAATADATAALRRDVMTAHITPTLNVAQFIEQTDSADVLDQTISRAQLIGGPRWIDDQTCQVRLEISGSRVVQALASVAAVHPRRSPMPAAALERRLSDWNDRTFGATGTAISAERVQRIRPVDLGDRWSTISDELRSKAVADAKHDAAQHIINDIRPIQITSGQTVNDLLTHEPVQRAVNSWLASCPVTQVRFGDDLQVELTMAVSSDDLLDTVINAAQTIPDARIPTDPVTLNNLRREFARRVSAAIGRAGVSPQITPTTQPTAAVLISDEPPGWIEQMMQADGVESRGPSVLRTANAARDKAIQSLRSRIGALSLTSSLTIDQAAARDPRINEAVNRALLHARVDKVDYRADGSVQARMTADLRDVWFEIEQLTDR